MVQWNTASFWIIEQSHKKFALFKLLIILQSFAAVGIENEYISYLLFIYIYVSVYLYFNEFMYMFMHSSWTTLFFNKQGKAEYYGKLKSLVFPILDSSLTLILEPMSIIYIADDEVALPQGVSVLTPNAETWMAIHHSTWGVMLIQGRVATATLKGYWFKSPLVAWVGRASFLWGDLHLNSQVSHNQVKYTEEAVAVIASELMASFSPQSSLNHAYSENDVQTTAPCWSGLNGGWGVVCRFQQQVPGGKERW